MTPRPRGGSGVVPAPVPAARPATPAPPAPRPVTPAPAPAPVAPAPPVLERTDRVLVQLTGPQLAAAAQAIASLGVQISRVEGDAIEFECPASVVSVVLRGMLDVGVEIYGLARMPLDAPTVGADEAIGAGPTA